MAQTIRVKFFDPVEAHVINERFVDIRQVGIYKGGYISKVDDTDVTVSPLEAEISDGTYQVKLTTDAAVPLVVIADPAGVYIIMRWSYLADPTNPVSFLAISAAGLQANDVIIGRLNFVGAVLSTITYGERTTPDTHDLFLKVEPSGNNDLYVRVRAGRVNYGASNFDVPDTLKLMTTPITAAAVRIDVIYIDTDGSIQITQGVEKVPPLIPVPPDYGGRTAIAQVTVTQGQLIITTANIKDVRAFLSGGGYAVYAP